MPSVPEPSWASRGTCDAEVVGCPAEVHPLGSSWSLRLGLPAWRKEPTLPPLPPLCSASRGKTEEGRAGGPASLEEGTCPPRGCSRNTVVPQDLPGTVTDGCWKDSAGRYAALTPPPALFVTVE